MEAGEIIIATIDFLLNPGWGLAIVYVALLSFVAWAVIKSMGF